MTAKRPLRQLLPLALAAAATPTLTAAEIATVSGTLATPTAVRAQAMSEFQAVNTGARFAADPRGRIGRVYGPAFSYGDTPQQSTQAFIDQHTDMWGVHETELVPIAANAAGTNTLPVFYQPETDSYKFTATYFEQVRDGLPVFDSGLVLLTRNQDGNPLVLASSQLHDLSAYHPDPVLARAAVDHDALVKLAADHFNGAAQIWSTNRVIFAGDSTTPHPPTVAQNTVVDVDGFKKFRIITDVATGEILYEQPLTHTIDVSGNVSALATEGVGADFCEDEVMQPLPYLNVSIQGGGASITDVDGNFTIGNGGSANVTINADLDGQWFDVFNYLGSETSESLSGSPGSPFNILFNALNNSEQVRAEVNAYIEANRIRDWVIAANPSFPTMSQPNFPVTVNRTDGFCPGNAWYDSGEQSINFCLAGSSNPNTAWSSVVHHEFGHHLVNVAPFAAQGQYGEGYGDAMSTIILDSPRLGAGFFNNCNGELRNALNAPDYPCFSNGHACAELLSGVVWQTRELLAITEPADYQTMLMNLAIGQVLVQVGDQITPQMTIDWLTLDDDDADILNGTPHYFEIDGGFSAHNMDAPELNLVDINILQPLPEFVDPAGTTTIAAEFLPLAGELDPSTPTLMVDTGDGYQPYPMIPVSGAQYEATFPAADCGSIVDYYISAESTSGVLQVSPPTAPATPYSTIAATEAPVIVFEDDFESNMGWTVSGDASDGQWNRGIPVNCNRGDPATDFDGSGQAFVTDNSSASFCNSDVDGGSTILTSPVMDATGNAILSYARWYDNTAGDAANSDVFLVEVSDNAGSSWVELETVGPAGSEAGGGWYAKQFDLNNVPGFLPNDQFRIRFIASDLGSGSIVEAAVDAVKLSTFACTPSCPADITGDGTLDFFDVSAFLNAFQSGDATGDFDGNGNFDFFDVSGFLNAFNAGCP